ncbi:MAG: anaerobic dehydrogenase, typically selenocysteine-containing [Symbiobacteriaceae bacterium]|jgi:nitrate reductase NapA|nr:anaerobic dehydrogenase, typically selenocysteine-containing [Symbiobacteriaceae bacterium]
MQLTRRNFLQATAAAAATAAALSATGCADKKANPKSDLPADLEWTKAVCRYCGIGCGVMVGTKDGKVLGIKGDQENPVNKGLLCVKGWYLHKILYAEDRLKTPMIKKDGKFVPATWDEALDLVASRFKEIIAKDGPDAVSYYGSGQNMAEEAYVVNKLFKGVIGTNNVEGNPRTCMASAVAGHTTTFGKDEPMGCLDDIEAADVFFITGSNTAECHPVVWSRITNRKLTGKDVKIIVADPRRHRVHEMADMSLEFIPGTDIALFNAMAQVIIAENLHDANFISKHTTFQNNEGPIDFEKYKAFLQDYTPEKAAAVTGLTADQIREAARLFAAKDKQTMTMWTMGINQRVQGTWANNLLFNLHLLTGKIGRPGSTPFSLTGQPSACGSIREVGALSHLLPAHRVVANEAHRKEVAAVWGTDPAKMSPKNGLHMMDMFKGLVDGRVKAMLISTTNPGHSLPNADFYRKGMEKAFLVVIEAYHPTRTTELADVLLPAAMWVEKEGIYGNTDRRTQYIPKLVNAPGEAKSDVWIFLELAKRMGFGKFFEHYTSTEVIWEEYRKLAKGTKMDLAPYARYKKERGVRWPVPTDDHAGTVRRYSYPDDPFVTKEEGIKFYGKPDGKAVVFARPFQGAAEKPDADYPFWFSTGRVLEHWHTMTMTGKVPELMRATPDWYAELHPEDAAKLGIADGDPVKLTTRRGTITLPAKLKARGIPQKGMVMVMMHDDRIDKLANLLTNDAVDAASKQPEYKLCAVKVAKG